MLSPLIEEMDKENKDEAVKFVKVNVDEQPELSGLFWRSDLFALAFATIPGILAQES